MGHHWCSTSRHRLRSTWCLPEHVSGRAWTTDGRAGIAAPSYADSLVISGPGAFADALLAIGLEVFPVDRHRQIPIWAD